LVVGEIVEGIRGQVLRVIFIVGITRPKQNKATSQHKSLSPLKDTSKARAEAILPASEKKYAD